jgi:hypothetical protein
MDHQMQITISPKTGKATPGLRSLSVPQHWNQYVGNERGASKANPYQLIGISFFSDTSFG